MKHRKTFLGIGWKFPPTFDKETMSVQMVSEEEDIRESLFILLSTKPGERVMLPEYGCNLQSAVFDTINTETINRIRSYVSHAILYFEPRINVEKIDISTESEKDGLLLINVEYQITNTNRRSNMVYPYYIIEGTDARYKPI